jgi:hypothetical protein
MHVSLCYAINTEMHVYVTNVLFYCVIVFYVIVGKKLIRACVCMLNNPTLNKAYLFIYHYFCIRN